MHNSAHSFSEEQKLISSPWLIGASVALSILLNIQYLWSVFQGKTTRPSDVLSGILLSSVVPLSLILLPLLMDIKLISKINDHGVSFKWHPFRKKFIVIPWSDIVSVEYIRNSFVGYGWRFSKKYGTVNNVSGNKALLIVLKNGNTYLLGTQSDENELLPALQRSKNSPIS